LPHELTNILHTDTHSKHTAGYNFKAHTENLKLLHYDERANDKGADN